MHILHFSQYRQWLYRILLLSLCGMGSVWGHTSPEFRVWISSENNSNDNEGSGSMFVFDGELPHSLLARIDPDQKKSHHPWISPDGLHLLGSNRVSNSITIYDTDLLTVQSTIALGPNPTHVQWGMLDDHYRYAFVGITSSVDAGGGYVSVIDLETQLEVAQVPEDPTLRQNGTHDADVTPDGEYVYFGNTGSNTVFKIAIDAEQGFPLVQTIEVGLAVTPADVSVQGIRILPSGEKMYVSNEEGSVSVVKLNDEAPDEVLATIDVTNGAEDTGVHNSRISADGHWVYVGSRGTGFVTVIDTETDTVVANIETGMGANTPEFSPDGKYNLVPNQETDFVSVIDVATQTKIKDITTGQGPHNIRFSPAGDFAFITCKDDSVVSVIDMSTLTLLHNLAVDPNPNGIVIQLLETDSESTETTSTSEARIMRSGVDEKYNADVTQTGGLGFVTVFLLLSGILSGFYWARKGSSRS